LRNSVVLGRSVLRGREDSPGSLLHFGEERRFRVGRRRRGVEREREESEKRRVRSEEEERDLAAAAKCDEAAETE